MIVTVRIGNVAIIIPMFDIDTDQSKLRVCIY